MKNSMNRQDLELFSLHPIHEKETAVEVFPAYSCVPLPLRIWDLLRSCQGILEIFAHSQLAKDESQISW